MTRSTASIAGKLAAMAAASSIEKQAVTETFESVSLDQLISEWIK